MVPIRQSCYYSCYSNWSRNAMTSRFWLLWRQRRLADLTPETLRK